MRQEMEYNNMKDEMRRAMKIEEQLKDTRNLLR